MHQKEVCLIVAVAARYWVYVIHFSHFGTINQLEAAGAYAALFLEKINLGFQAKAPPSATASIGSPCVSNPALTLIVGFVFARPPIHALVAVTAKVSGGR